MKTIETIGIPGSGKSTINNLLLVEKSEAIYTPEYFILKHSLKNDLLVNLIKGSKLKKLFTNHYYAKNNNELLSKFLIENVDLLSFVLNLNYFTQQSNTDQSIVLKWMLRLMVDYQQSRISGDKYFIFDEGFLHKSISLFVNPSQKVVDKGEDYYSKLETYLNLIPIPSILIVVEVDVNTAFERLKRRGFTQRTKNNSESEIVVYLNSCDKLMKHIIQFAKKSNCEVIHVPNNQDLFSLKKELLHKISL